MLNINNSNSCFASFCKWNLSNGKERANKFVFELTLPNVYFSHPGIYLRWVALEGAVAFLRWLCSTLRLRRWRLLRTWLLGGRIWAEMSACRGFRCRSGGVSWVRTLWWLRTGTRSGQVLGRGRMHWWGFRILAAGYWSDRRGWSSWALAADGVTKSLLLWTATIMMRVPILSP